MPFDYDRKRHTTDTLIRGLVKFVTVCLASWLLFLAFSNIHYSP